MKHVIRSGLWGILLVGLVTGVICVKCETRGKMGSAAGSFDIKMTPGSSNEEAGAGRMSLDKQYHGQLEAAAKGEMLTAMTDVKGSAGYVAVEKVTGKLNGRPGTFVLQHNATMNRGVGELNIIVVPDSGTGELKGLTGKMRIDVDGGRHSYVFEYTLPD